MRAQDKDNSKYPEIHSNAIKKYLGPKGDMGL